MRDDLQRIEAHLADVRQALSEARSADVRAFLRELLTSCEEQLARLGDGGAPAVSEAPAGETQEPLA